MKMILRSCLETTEDREGVWPRPHDVLRSQLRQVQGRHKHPAAGCLDSQSVKCTATPGLRGYDAGKKINGRKRHLLVDTLGLLMSVRMATASVQDREVPGCSLEASRAVARGCAGFGWAVDTAGAWWTGWRAASSSASRSCRGPGEPVSSPRSRGAGSSSAPSAG